MPMYGALKKEDKVNMEGSFDDGLDEKSSDTSRAQSSHALEGPGGTGYRKLLGDRAKSRPAPSRFCLEVLLLWYLSFT